jgi:hypothetical protein
MEQFAFRMYVTDALKFLANLNMRWTEMISEETETRSPEEIKAAIKSRIRSMGNGRS